MTRFDAQLRASGMNAAESAAKAALLEKLDGELSVLSEGTADAHSAFFIPGRLEFLGKHTD
ncbi:MAG: hypothetical protein WA153_00495, partial [Candidatus Acidiferrales bacterium]